MGRSRTRLALLLLAVLLLLGLAACTDPGETTDADGASAPEEAGGPAQEGPDEAMEVASPAYEDGGSIPLAHVSTVVDGGENVSIPLAWSGAPDGTASFAVVVVDRHPIAEDWVHWMVVGIGPDVTGLAAGASGAGMPAGAIELDSTSGTAGYDGPGPPPGSGDHEYETTVYALSAGTLELAQDASLAEFLAAVEPVTLDSASISGMFEVE